MRVGFVGWRGMVGSVLMERMKACGDFAGLEPTFFSTSQAGGAGPDIDGQSHALADAFDLARLGATDVIVTCQGSGYTTEVYRRLRATGWDGVWIDAARTLRMEPETVLVLDPVNRSVIDRGLAQGCKTFAGPNCTVSLLIMALQGLIEAELVEWVSSMTYQAASGAGAENVRELVAQWGHAANAARAELDDPAASVLAIEARVTQSLRDGSMPVRHFGYPLAGSLLPWIDEPVGGGQTREEWKAQAEGNKILGRTTPIPFDGTCVRVGALRCHSQGVTVKLVRDVPLREIEALLVRGSAWVRLVPNEREATLARLTPAAVTGTLEVAVGRVRKLGMGSEYLGLFTVGDQLLWGAAEPLRRTLAIVRGLAP